MLAGILIGTSYIPMPPWAIFFGLVPLLIFWSRTLSAKQAFIGGWIAQFIFNLIGFHWIGYTAVEFGHFPLWGGILTLVGFASIAHLYYPVAGWIAVILARRFAISSKLFIPLAMLCFAVLEELFPMIFPWHLGYPWIWAGLPGMQLADVIGFDGLNLVTLSANALLAMAMLEFLQARREKAMGFVGAAVAIVLAVNLLGIGRDKPWRQTDATLNVVVVQGNIGNFDKLLAEKGREFRRPIIEKYIELSQKGLNENPGTQIMLLSLIHI